MEQATQTLTTPQTTPTGTFSVKIENTTYVVQKSDAERHLHGVLATPCRRASDTSPP